MIAAFGFALDSIVFSAGMYYNWHSRNIVAFSGDEEDVAFTLPQDIGVTDIEIADTILVEYLSLPFWGGGWIQHFDFINLEVTNFGLDTVREFTIKNQAVSQCGWCSHYNPSWKIDSLVLLPGSSANISLGAFQQSCIYNNLSELCLTSILPNDKADGNYLNDEFCEPFSILIGTETITENVSFVLRPNPAQDYVNIITEDPNGQKVQFIDMYGRQVMNVLVKSSFEEINIEQLPVGLYTVLVSKDGGIEQTFKLSIIR